MWTPVTPGTPSAGEKIWTGSPLNCEIGNGNLGVQSRRAQMYLLRLYLAKEEGFRKINYLRATATTPQLVCLLLYCMLPRQDYPARNGNRLRKSIDPLTKPKEPYLKAAFGVAVLARHGSCPALPNCVKLCRQPVLARQRLAHLSVFWQVTWRDLSN